MSGTPHEGGTGDGPRPSADEFASLQCFDGIESGEVCPSQILRIGGEEIQKKGEETATVVDAPLQRRGAEQRKKADRRTGPPLGE